MEQKQTKATDRIEEDRIILDGSGKFPKKIILVEKHGKEKEYELKKTSKGGYLLN